ncbi:MAG: hypothetical protein MI741_17775, partial [Rhodospirillales bacterium]|nr:hypothetical protein [Rhodospirillales bacterium]
KQISGMGGMSRMKALMGMGNMDLSAMGSRGKMPRLPGAEPQGKAKGKGGKKFKQRKRKSR